VRELRNVVERAALLAGAEPRIGPEHVLLDEDGGERPPGAASPGPRPAIDEASDERARIEDALAECGGNQTRAAELLGISRRTLVNWIEKHGITRPRKSGPGTR